MIPEIKVDFRLIGIDILPDEITRLLGITPSRTWLADDHIQKTKLKRKEHGWLLDSVSPKQTYAVSDLVFPLLEVLLPKSDLITELCKKYRLYSEISIVVYISDETPAINFDDKIISGLKRLETTLDIDIILLSGRPGQAGE